MKKRLIPLLMFILSLAVAFTLFSCGDVDEPDGGDKKPHTHTASEWITDNEPTCKTEGTKHKECTECKEVLEIDVIPKTTAHTLVTDARVEPTETATGLTEGSHCSLCGTVLVAQNVIPMLKAEETKLVSKTLTVSESSVTGSFPYSTDVFNFSLDFTVTNNAPWVISTDVYGMQSIPSKTAPLAEGNNRFYVFITNPDQTIKTYTVDLYRNHMYTVSFNACGGATPESQRVEEGKLATELTTTRTGYTFAGWDYDFTKPVMSHTTVSASWTANTNTKYVVEYYLENVEKNDYVLDHTDTLYDTTDTTAEAEIKNFGHFTHNKNMGKLSGNINGEGNLVLQVYYTRNTYKISNANPEYGSVANTDTYAYGSSVNITSTATSALGCKFLGWYADGECVSSDTSYAFTAEYDVVARFDVKDEMKNFNLTATQDSCTITGIKDTSITEIIVPDYVTRINKGAFSGCSALESITIPFVGGSKSATSASSSTLFGYIFGTSNYTGGVSTEQYDGYYRSTYYIPSSLKSLTVTGGNIFYGAFYNCSSLTSVTIGNSVTRIGSSSFWSCASLTSIKVDENNAKYKDIDGNLYSKDGKTLIQYAMGKTATSFTIPDGVTSIDYEAFSGCTSLTSVVIPDSVTSIGYGAFYYCTSLTSVTIPDSVTSIGSYAFENCGSLTSVTIPGSVTSIGDYAFYNCYKLVEVYNLSELDITAGSSSNGYVAYYALDVYTSLDKQSKQWETDDGFMFYEDGDTCYLFGYKGNKTDITLPENCNGKNYEIYKYAFYSCNSLTSVVIPDSVKSIGDDAFYSCDSLTSVSMDDSVTSIGYCAFSDCTSLTSVTIGNSVTSIGDCAFLDCTSLESIVIPDSVTSIGKVAFYGCRSLTSVVIPDSVKSIGEWAFYYCTSLTIYCEAESEPSGWDSDWNYSDRPVVWGYKGN